MKLTTQKRLERAQAFLRKICFYDVMYSQDTMITVCKACGKKGWLIKDIKHKRNCVVAKALK